MDEPPFALGRLALPASIVAKGGSFFTVSTLVLFSSTSIACGFLVKKTPAGLEESLAGVRFVAAIGCKTGWERTMPRLDGVIAVIDANVHGFCLAFVFR